MSREQQSGSFDRRFSRSKKPSKPSKFEKKLAFLQDMSWINVDVAKFVAELSINYATLHLSKASLEDVVTIWFVDVNLR